MLATVLVSMVAVTPAVAQRQGRPRQANPDSPAATRAERLDAFIRRGMTEWEIPGLSVVVVYRDSVAFLRGYGVRRIGAADPVDPATMFGMMSTTKALTSMSLAMLVDSGRLRWDDPVTRHVPEFELPDAWPTRELTIADLLTHRAGLPNADLLWVRGDMSAAEIFRRVRLLDPAYSFRDNFVYQNVMYGLAGEVVARVSGVSWADFVRTRIFEPLGMTRSSPLLGIVAATGGANVSVAHDRVNGALAPIEEQSVDVLGSAGSAWSTAEDMGRWVRFLLDSGRANGRRLVSEEQYRRIFRPHTMVPLGQFYPSATITRPHWMSYGLGWFQQDYNGRFVAFHTGSLAGRVAILGLMPDERLGVYVFANRDHVEFRHALMLQVFDLWTDAPARDWSAELKPVYDRREAAGDSARARRQASRVPDTRPSLPLERYAGTYEHPIWGVAEVSLVDGSLHLAIGMRRGPLAHFHYDTFVASWENARGESMVRFILDERGTPAEFRLGGAETGFRRRRER
jgi:CubicO group peptidase (beta-lactamase class C family)